MIDTSHVSSAFIAKHERILSASVSVPGRAKLTSSGGKRNGPSEKRNWPGGKSKRFCGHRGRPHGKEKPRDRRRSRFGRGKGLSTVMAGRFPFSGRAQDSTDSWSRKPKKVVSFLVLASLGRNPGFGLLAIPISSVTLESYHSNTTTINQYMEPEQ